MVGNRGPARRDDDVHHLQSVAACLQDRALLRGDAGDLLTRRPPRRDDDLRFTEQDAELVNDGPFDLGSWHTIDGRVVSFAFDDGLADIIAVKLLSLAGMGR